MPAGAELSRGGNHLRRVKAPTKGEGTPQALCSLPVPPPQGAHQVIASGDDAFKAHTPRTRSSARARHERDGGLRRRSVRRLRLADHADTLASVRGRAVQTGTPRWQDSSQRLV